MVPSRTFRLPTMLLLLLVVVVVVVPVKQVAAIPMKSTIRRDSVECLYDFIEFGDSVTVSGFILSGSSLKGTMSLEGPLPGMTDPKASTWEVYEKATQVRSNPNHPLPLTYRQVIDWEHLLIQDTLTDDEEEEDEGDELDDDITMEEGDEEDPQKLEELQAKRLAKLQARTAAKKQRQMARLEERRKRLQEHQRKQEAVADAEGDPMQYTTRVPVSGWYVACLEPYEDQVVAELEMRKASELGGLDEDGNVFTHEEYFFIQLERDMEKDTASAEGMVDEDFDVLKDQIKQLRDHLTNIMSIQLRDRRRISVNQATAEHSHSRLVLNSFFETILFMAVTGYQVYTIRKWFSGKPSLGR